MGINLPFSPEIIHIYGPLGIQAYGLFITIAIIILLWAVKRDKRFTQLNLEPIYLNLLLVCIIAGTIGARLIEVISEWHNYHHWYDWLALWNGGFSALGAIIGIVILGTLYLRKYNIPILPTCDLIATYAPLLQAIARLGCFTAGCCYGIPTHGFLSVIYTNTDSFAPQGIAIHPTQLYSSLLLFIIFLFMYLIAPRLCKIPGQLFILYLAFAAGERFVVDFWRSDRIMITSFLSFHQIIALVMICIAFFGYLFLSRKPK